MKVNQTKASNELMIEKIRLRKMEMDEKILKEKRMLVQEEINRDKLKHSSELQKQLFRVQEILQKGKFELMKRESKLKFELESLQLEINMIRDKKSKLKDLAKECRDGGNDECHLDEITMNNVWSFNPLSYSKYLTKTYDSQITREKLGTFIKEDGGVGKEFIKLRLKAHFNGSQNNICKLFTVRNRNKSYKIKLGNLENSYTNIGLELSEKEIQLEHYNSTYGDKLDNIKFEISKINSDIEDNKMNIKKSRGK